MGKTRDTANLISDGNLSVDITNDRVGIGSTVPQYKLDVDGDINLSGTFRQGGVQFVASRWTTGTGNDIYRLSGDVGIGTTNPQYTLDVSGDINFTGTFRQNGTQFVASRWTTGTGNDIYRLSGNIGIGTTNPTSPLSVQGNTLVSGITTVNTELDVGIGATILTALPSGRIGVGNTNPIGQLQISSGPVIIGAATSTGTASQTLQVTGGAYVSGNAGIGTTISSESGLSVLPKIQILNNSNADGRLILRAKPGNLYRWNIDNDGSTNNFRIFREDDPTAANGSVAVTVSIAGTLTTTTLVETSSITLKENINPIVNSLNKVIQLNPVTYDRKSGASKNEAGLIAEEVNEIIPNIVSKDDEGNPNGINYTKLSVYLIDAIKELKKEIDDLRGN